MTADPRFLDFGVVPAGENKIEEVEMSSSFFQPVVVESNVRTADRLFFEWSVCVSDPTAAVVAKIDAMGECVGEGFLLLPWARSRGSMR